MAMSRRRDHAGEAVTTSVPDFPVMTPLQRIHVSLVGGVFKAPTAPTPVPSTADLDPL